MKRKIIAVLLCVAICLSVTPVVLAQNDSNYAADNIVEASENQTESQPYIVGELTEKRTENTKYFLMSDRTITAAMYNKTVHYKNGDIWHDIDNSFSATEDGNELENKSNSFKTIFSKKSNGNKLVTLTKNNYSISWTLDDAKKVSAQVFQSSETESEDISVLKNLEGLVTYPEIQTDVDLQYVVSSTGVKENIILQSADAPMEYSFAYKFNKLEYRTNAKDQIEFYDKSDPENIIFTIDVPYMYDSNEAYSDNIEMQISESNNGFTLNLVPDREWLLSEERVYPVVIDPTTISSQDARDAWDITLYNAWADAYDYDRDEILVGSNTSSNIYRTLLKFYNLPTIEKNGIIVNAKMYLSSYFIPSLENYSPTDFPSLKPRPTDDIQVNIHRITSNWPEQNPTWSAHSGIYNSIIEDYFIYNDSDDYFSADITNLVSDWYSGAQTNYGVMIKANDETAANHVMQFASSDFGTDESVFEDYRPFLTVNYRVCIGLEDYWSYTTQSMGSYGTGYVNNYNGNLTYIHDDVGFNSLINGFTLSHVFNSDTSYSGTGRYGNGWNLNLVQHFKPVTIKNNDAVKFVYTDGDGTKHYFHELENGKIVDEDGLGYTYTPINEIVDSGTTPLKYKITTKDDVVLKFDQWGFLRRIIDANGNTIYLHYSPGATMDQNHLTQVATSSGGVIRLNYDNNYKLTSIKDNANRITSYSYTGGNLTKITYPDVTELNLGYSGNNICQIKLPDDKKLCYSYYPNLKISAQNIKSADNTITAQYSFNYYDNNKTEVTDLVSRKLTYLFDSVGRVTCAYDSLGNSYSQTYEPTTTNPNSIFKNNKLNVSSNNIRYINNLITNPVFSSNLCSWTEYKEAPDQTQISVVSDQIYISSKSVKITSTASSIQALIQCPATSAGKTYTLSANLKTNNIISNTHGVGVEIVTSSPTGNKYYYSDFITGSTNAEVNNGFVTASVTAAMASNENIIRIGVGLYNASGTVWIDSVQLEEGDTANKINLISNSSFEKSSGINTLPTGFTGEVGSNGGGVTNSVTFGNGGAYTMKFTGNPTAFRSARQAVNVSGKAGDVFSYGGWAKANSIPKHSNGNIANFQMCVKVYYADTSTEWFKSEFNPYTDEWQYTQGVFSPKKDYIKIELCFGYDYNCNNAYFDNVFLYHDIAQSYKYDKDGNVVSTADYAKQQSSFEYTNSNLTKLINPDGTSYEYTYDSKKNLTDAESNIGVKYHMTYDGSGNVLTSEITSTDDSSGEKITSSATYQNNGNYPHTVTDSLGNTTTYTYDTARGIQTDVTDAKGNTTSYSHNGQNDYLNSVTSANSTVNYTYDNTGVLQNITSPSGTVYNFAYDQFGNRTDVTIGDRILSINTYDATRGLLMNTYYGNVYVLYYDYDILDRLIQKTYNGTVIVNYKYDKFGNLYEKQDTLYNVNYRYNYDLSGRLSGVAGSNNTSLNYVYDNFNRIEKYIAKLPNHTNITEYIYGDSSVSGQKDGLIYGVKQNGIQKLSYAYDNLARLNTRTLNTTTPFVTQYGYHAGATEGTTTTLVKTVQNGNDVLEYAYDAVGNITEIKKNNAACSSYTYDNLNQLLTETRNGDVYAYTYDNGGNIQSVTKNGETIKSYTYGNSEWRDLLTEYNGVAITYDEIGNPKRYYNGNSLIWQYGRHLMAVRKSDGNVVFKYDAEGNRFSKTFGGVTTNYYRIDGILMGESTGDNHITYLYDENGAPYGFVYNDTYYYYVQNAQGDIIGILDASGNQIVEYTYSAWGEILSITGSHADTIGQINPLRYRGYYYDVETGFYATGTRYYDPEIGRFINADSLIDNRGIITQNLFQYCGNNPVNNADPSGNLFGAIVGIGLLVIGMVATLSGCSSKPAATTSTPSTPSKPSTPSSSTSSTTPPHIPTPQEKSYAATVYAEAGGQNKRSKQAVAHVMNNRIGTRLSWTDIESVISAKYQFDGYNSPMYQTAMNYYNNGICNNSIEQAAMDECLAVVIPIYSGAEADITGGALYFHSFPNPSDWAYHNSYTQVYVSGTEKFWFYK